MSIVSLLDHAEFGLKLVIKFILVRSVLVFVDSGEYFIALRVVILLKLENELVNFLSASTNMTLGLVCLNRQFVQFLLKLANLHILRLYLIFFDREQALHILVLFFERNDVVIASTVFFKQFAEILVCVLSFLLHLSLDQRAFTLRVRRPFLDQLFACVKRINLTCLSLEKALVKVDQCFILHLAVAAIACAILFLVLLRQLQLVWRAGLTDGGSALGAVVVLRAKDAEVLERAEG